MRTQEEKRQYWRDYYRKNKDRWRTPAIRERDKLYSATRRRSPDFLIKRRARLYGLTVETITAMEKAQSGECAICQRVAKLVIDHCHATGRVRAMLCERCNQGIGQFKEDVSTLRAAIGYLECWAELRGPP